MGTAHACVARILEKPTPSAASDTAEAMGTLMLRGLGLSSAEAQRITKKAVADILSRVPAVKEKSA